MKNHTESVITHAYTYTAVFEPSQEGGYTVTCPALPGVVTEGDTLKEARAMVKEAVECYLESLQKDGLPIPESEEYNETSLREGITVELKTV